MNLIPILQKYFKEGDRLYSVMHGWVTLVKVNTLEQYSIVVADFDNSESSFTSKGRYFDGMGECLLFPSPDKDWSSFKHAEAGDAVVYKKEGVWHLGRAAKGFGTEEIGVKQSDGSVYFPEKLIKAELFDFDNFENNM